MDRIDRYRQIIKRLLRERETFARPSLPEGLEVSCLFDVKSDQYALMTTGWAQGDRVTGATLLLRIRNGKIWIEDDQTDAPIAEDLVFAGVPRQNIVLGFQPPEAREFTQFAAA